MMVSVIIPCFNVQDYIEECLKSVYEQSYIDLEIICVDNNSIDNTFLILQKHEKEGKIILYKELKKGAPAARNLGLKHAKGEWVQFLDADDLLLPDKISNQIGIIDSNNQIGIIAGNYLKRDLNGDELVSTPHEDNFLGLLNSNLGITSANLFQKNALIAIGGWNQNINSSQEYELMFNLIKSDIEVERDKIALTIIRERKEGQISQRNPKERWKQYIQLRVDIIEYLIKNKPDYYLSKETEIKQILFDSNRILAKYDLRKARELHSKYLNGFVPSISEVTSGSYIKLLKIVGFFRAEKIKKWLT